MTPIAHNKPWILEDDLAAVRSSLGTHWLAPGPETAALGLPRRSSTEDT